MVHNYRDFVLRLDMQLWLKKSQGWGIPLTLKIQQHSPVSTQYTLLNNTLAVRCLPCDLVFLCVENCLHLHLNHLVVDGDRIHSGRDVDGADDDVAVLLMLPSSQLAELDQAYKSGGQDAARQLLQSQSMEQVAI